MAASNGAAGGARAAAAALLALALGLLLVPAGGTPAQAAVTARIDRLIYPTFGYPQMVREGESFTLEFDFRRDAPSAALPLDVRGWQASITSSNAYTPCVYRLEVESVEFGTSLRWPPGSGRSVYDVYRVTVGVPPETMPDLYDLAVQVTADGVSCADSQPHAVCVVRDWKQDYRVIQWTDVHVHDVQYGVAGFEGTAWTDREVHDARYLKKAVQAVNLLAPDFLVLTGDTVFGQRYLPEQWPPDDGRNRPGSTATEYEYEYGWCYEELQALEVPVFVQPGNHDGYYDTLDDGLDWFTSTYGPLYYSFDYGDHHYTAANSFDWPQSDREVKEFYTWLTGVLNPVSWQGQLQGGGDAPGAGSAPDPGTYTGQLAWIRDDLAAHQSSGFRVLLMHHDPTVPDMWEKKNYVVVTLGKDGAGRLATLRLCADYRVGLLLSGHDHKDQYHERDWSGGGGTTVFPNATSLCIQKDGSHDFYPGFKMAEFSGDTLASHSYRAGGAHYSYPCYDGCTVGGSTDLSTLDRPSIESAFSNGGDWSGGHAYAFCDVENRLERGFEDCRLEFYMPYPGPDAYYAVTGGRIVDMARPADGRLNLRVGLDLAPEAAQRVSLSLETDGDAPAGSVLINGGAAQTDALDVVLTLNATDGGSGVKDMMISNRADFAGARWEPYAAVRGWRLAEGPEGYRSVFVKFRDFTYPGHVSLPAADDVVYHTGSAPWKDRWYFAEGYTGAGFEEFLCILNPSPAPVHATLTYMPEGAPNMVRELDVPGLSRFTVNVNNHAGSGLNLSCLLEAEGEVVAERPVYFSYGGLWAGGHCVTGARSAETTLYFAEGYTGPGFEEWLTIQNPGAEDTEVTLTYMTGTGGNYTSRHRVAAHSRYTVMVNRDCPEAGDVSVRLDSERPVVAERPVYFSYGGLWAGGHCVMGARCPEAVQYFAEGYTGPGFEEWLTIQNPGAEDTEVTLTYMTGTGGNYTSRHRVAAHSRYTVMVNRDCPEAGDVSVRLDSERPVVAERPVYFSYGGLWEGGHCVTGAADLDLHCYFAEGYTGPGFEEWLTIQNPGAEDTEVTLTYMTGTGGNYTSRHRVAAHSRYTVMVNRDCPEAGDVSVRLDSERPVAAERPAYYNYSGKWAGGHCVTAFSKR